MALVEVALPPLLLPAPVEQLKLEGWMEGGRKGGREKGREGGREGEGGGEREILRVKKLKVYSMC